MRPILTISQGQKQDRFELVQNIPKIFGRDSAADIVLSEKKISRQHAEILWNENNQIILTDLRSLNGTSVNGEKILSPTRITDSDRITIGSYQIEIHFNEFEGVSLASGNVKDLSLIHGRYETKEKPLAEPKEFQEEEERSLLDVLEDDISDWREDISSIDDQTGGRIIQGKIKELSLPDMIQMLATTKKTGQLVVSKNKMVYPPKHRTSDVVSLFIRQGSLIAAVYQDLVGEEAFYEALKINEGYFTLFPHESFNFPNPILSPLESLLLEGMRRLDEGNRESETIRMTDRFEAIPDKALTELDSDQLQILQLVWKHKEVSLVHDQSPLESEITNSIIRILEKKGYLRKA